MDIFEYALQLENQAENYYRQLAQQTTNKGLKSIFNMLTGEEIKHGMVIKEMKTRIPENITKTNVLRTVTKVFKEIAENGEKWFLTDEELEAYREAQEIEKASEDFYLEKSDEVENDAQRDILKKLANEERKHYLILQNIIDFVSRPANWLENAEWYHLEEY